MPPEVPELALSCPSHDWRSQDSNLQRVGLQSPESCELGDCVSRTSGWRVEGSEPLGPAGW